MKHAKKHVKRFASLLLAMVMVLSLSLTAFATEGEGGGTPATDVSDPGIGTGPLKGGTITVTNAAPAETYSLYQLLQLESYTPATTDAEGKVTGGQYAYKVTDKWKDFFSSTDAQAYFSVDSETGLVKWMKTNQEGSVVADFAKLALQYAKANGINPETSKTVPGAAGGNATTLTFNNLHLGYYLCDTTLGSLCALNTTNPSVNILEKNAVPENKKEVSEGSNWQNTNDASIGDTVYFKSTVSFESGTDKLVFHDEMDAALAFQSDSVEVVLDAQTATKAKATTLKPGTEGTEGDYDYTLVFNPASEIIDGQIHQCTFHIEFTQTFLDSVSTGAHTLTITYSAILTESAKVGGGENASGNAENVNISKVSYGENNHYTNDSKTVTKTWKLPVFKYTGEASSQQGLPGAKFTLQNSDELDIDLIEVSNGKETGQDDGEAIYRVATAAEKNATDKKTITEITTNASGKFTIIGLDSGTYYLTETEAPEGYNKLERPATIVINSDGSIKRNETPATDGVIKIQNNAGSLLPNTGGIGTTIFYVVGSILLVGAAILLITKRRMSAQK